MKISKKTDNLKPNGKKDNNTKTIAIIIFCITLFLYLHIYYQLKTSNDLEIYEIENPSKEKLEEIRIKKNNERGGFNQNLFLIDTDKQ